jgi:hypothetical protein
MKPLSVIFLTLALSVGSFAHQKVQSVDDILQCYIVEGRLVCESTRKPVDSNPKKKRPVFGRNRELITPPSESNDELTLHMAVDTWKRTPARVRQSLMGR